MSGLKIVSSFCILPSSFVLHVVHGKITRSGKVVTPMPNPQKNLIAFGLFAKLDGIVGIAHRLTIDFHNDITLFQAGFG